MMSRLNLARKQVPFSAAARVAAEQEVQSRYMAVQTATCELDAARDAAEAAYEALRKAVNDDDRRRPSGNEEQDKEAEELGAIRVCESFVANQKAISRLSGARMNLDAKIADEEAARTYLANKITAEIRRRTAAEESIIDLISD